jgi:putative sterol carrier protein
MKATYELNLTGDEGGTWHLSIADEKCQLLEGPAAASDVAITISLEDWRELLAGRLDAFSAYLAGRIQVRGSIALAMQLQTIFGF